LLYRQWQQRVEQRRALETNAAALTAEREALDWQLKELEALSFTLDGWRELLAEHGQTRQM